jgi:nitrite reductase/ring-hydroxylating ferredoxin subunit
MRYDCLPKNIKWVREGVYVESRFVRVAGISDIDIGKMQKVTVGDTAVLIANVNGNFFAVDSVCTHFGGDLSEGILECNIITCPVHKARFDVISGKVVSPPAEALGRQDIESLSTYFVKIENQDILIRI